MAGKHRKPKVMCDEDCIYCSNRCILDRGHDVVGDEDHYCPMQHTWSGK